METVDVLPPESRRGQEGANKISVLLQATQAFRGQGGGGALAREAQPWQASAKKADAMKKVCGGH